MKKLLVTAVFLAALACPAQAFRDRSAALVASGGIMAVMHYCKNLVPNDDFYRQLLEFGISATEAKGLSAETQVGFMDMAWYFEDKRYECNTVCQPDSGGAKPKFC
jgi:hypothetical protein